MELSQNTQNKTEKKTKLRVLKMKFCNKQYLQKKNPKNCSKIKVFTKTSIMRDNWLNQNGRSENLVR